MSFRRMADEMEKMAGHDVQKLTSDGRHTSYGIHDGGKLVATTRVDHKPLEAWKTDSRLEQVKALKPDVWISDTSVEPKHRGQGMAKALREKLQQEYGSILTGINPKSDPAMQHINESQGFKKVQWKGNGDKHWSGKSGTVQYHWEKKAYTLQGHTKVQDIPISIENRKGSVRKGTNADGSEWSTKFKNPYGYITGTKGADGDGVDAYVGPDKSSPNAFVVHQHKDDGKGYDEDKVILGVGSSAEAKKLFLDHYDDPKFLGPVERIPIEDLPALLKKCRGKKLTKKASPMAQAFADKIATGDMIEYFNQNPKKYEEWKARRKAKEKKASFETPAAATRARALNAPADATLRRVNAARAAAAPDFTKQYPDVMQQLRSSPLGAHMDDSALQQNFLNTHQQMGNKTYGQTARRLGMGPKQQDMDAMMAQLSAPAQGGGAATVAPAARPVSGVRTVAPKPAVRPAARTMAPAQRPANTGGPKPAAPAAARPPARMPTPKSVTPKAKGFGSALKRVGQKTMGFLSKVASVDTYVGSSKDMDRGMFAERDFEPGEIIEVAPVLVVPRSQVGEGDVLRDYVFNFDKQNVMVALGYASMFNHSYEPNARYKKSKAARTLTFTAIKPIKEGEEIFVNYNLDPKKKDLLWFDVKEKETEKTATASMCTAFEEMA